MSKKHYLPPTVVLCGARSCLYDPGPTPRWRRALCFRDDSLASAPLCTWKTSRRRCVSTRAPRR